MAICLLSRLQEEHRSWWREIPVDVGVGKSFLFSVYTQEVRSLMMNNRPCSASLHTSSPVLWNLQLPQFLLQSGRQPTTPGRREERKNGERTYARESALAKRFIHRIEVNGKEQTKKRFPVPMTTHD